MKFWVGLIMAGFIVGSPVLAWADDIDLSTLTCSKFQRSDDETVKLILTWLDGYYKDQDDPPVIETDQFVDNAKKIGQYCAAHPDIGLITAADKLFASDDDNKDKGK